MTRLMLGFLVGLLRDRYGELCTLLYSMCTAAALEFLLRGLMVHALIDCFLKHLHGSLATLALVNRAQTFEYRENDPWRQGNAVVFCTKE